MPLHTVKEHLPKDIITIQERLDKVDNTPFNKLYYLAENCADIYFNTLTGPQPVDANAEVQDNMLQLESLEKEDTGIKQEDPVDVQNQDVEENAELAEIDAREQQEPVITQDSHAEEVQQEPVLQVSDQEQLNKQGLRYLKTRYQEHHKMIIIKLL